MVIVRTLAASLLFGLGATTTFSQSAPPPPASGPLRVTTDTPEYCETLAERVTQAEQARPNAPRRVEELAEEGHQMCVTGLIRGGLVRLRRALIMLRSENAK